MEQNSTTRREPGRAIHTKQPYLTTACSVIKTNIVSVLMWLSVIGGSLQ